MPSTRSKPNRGVLPTTVLSDQRPWVFPIGGHLLITTPRRIFAWDSTGLHIVFRSSHNSIAAACETRDGSGVLAIASKNTVVLHDTKRKHERSWGLDSDQDSVRHIQYSNDARSLFLSTQLDFAVHCYSVDKARLCGAICLNSSPVTALALSSSGNIILSASADPSVIRLTKLPPNGKSVLIDPRVSGAKVCFATSHPDKPDIFLLSFDDGTVVAFDFRKIDQERFAADSEARFMRFGEVGRFAKLHRLGIEQHRNFHEEPKTSPISGAAFVPGSKFRAITVGIDGRCRLVDFSNGGVILRTWQVGTPVTSVAVIPSECRSLEKKEGSNRFAHAQHQSAFGSADERPGSPTSLIVSRSDGKVDVYNTVGLILAQETICESSERILSIEWMDGPSPRSLHDEIPQPKYANSAVMDTLQIPTLPDDSTVRHLISGGHTKLQNQFIPANEYEDLFSPAKPPGNLLPNVFERKYSSPSRLRPRVSSRTYMRSPDSELTSREIGSSKLRKFVSRSSESHESDAALANVRDITRPETKLKPSSQNGTGTSPWSTRKRRSSVKWNHDSFNEPRSGRPQTSRASRLLSDLRRMRGDEPSDRQQGILAPYAALQRHKAQPRSINLQQKITLESPSEPPAAETFHLSSLRNRENWPRDSISSSSSIDPTIEDEDIWLTSESDSEETRHVRRHRNLHLNNKKDVPQPLQSEAPVSPLRQNSRSSSSLRTKLRASPKRPEVTKSTNLAINPSPRRHEMGFPLARKQRDANPTTQQSIPVSTDDRAIRNQREQEPAGGASGGGGGTLTMKPCAYCPETQSRMRELEQEVAKLKGEVLALRSVVRRNGLPFPACLR